jgi:hypothetical protein
MIYDLSQPAGWIDEDRGDVRCIERLEQIDDFRRVSEAVFEKNRETIANELAASLRAGSPHHRGYIAYSAGRPVSVGRLQTHPQSWFGGLYGGGTLIEFRGQGFYRAVVAARARDAIAIGAKYLRVDALPTSRPILERLGFEWITDTWPCEWRP